MRRTISNPGRDGKRWRGSVGWIAVLVMMLGWCGEGRGETRRTQTIQLEQGWNAVFLEVYPSDAEPSLVFSNTPIDIVAAYYAPDNPAQFVTDPGVDLFKEAGWGVWYAADRPDAFLKTLHAIHGQQAFLIHCQRGYTWEVTGEVVPPDVRWQSDSYNFVGFCVHPQGPPSFAQFFSGSDAHRGQPVYRLRAGSWRRVNNLESETLRSGEAFWIRCQGGSRYQGPLGVETGSRLGVVLGTVESDVILRNAVDHPVTPTIEHLAFGGTAVPLSVRVAVVDDGRSLIRSVSVPKPDGDWSQTFPSVEARQAIKFPLEARVGAMEEAVQSSLLKISTDMGTEIWIPVVALRQDLEEEEQ